MTVDPYVQFAELQTIEGTFAKAVMKGFQSQRKILEVENGREVSKCVAGWYENGLSNMVMYIHKASNPDPMITIYSKHSNGKPRTYFISGKSVLEANTRLVDETQARRMIALWRLTT